ncbi:MAG: 3-phosphoserine/phosphohydroxythreonine transaminase [bacterium]
MSTNRIYNFNAGPATLPLEALEEVRAGMMDFGGMSVLEISHRSKEYEAIQGETRSLVAELMGVPAGYQILFLTGGASLQFAMAPMNLMDKAADYAVTGYWSKKAVAEARLVGEVRTVFSSEEKKFANVPQPSEIKRSDGASYLHITTNNTIYGTQYQELPDPGAAPIVADMSSDILSYKIDVSRLGMIYAGAQKNIGPAGVTLVVIKDELVARKYRELPTMLKYSTHAENNSLFNTPPVFAIYVMRSVLRWIKAKGGVAAIEKTNIEKARILYDAIDASQIYKGYADKGSRSRMNVTFATPTSELADKFVAEAKARGMVGLKGHRALGGIRASIYNAFPIEGIKALVEFMKEFEKKA